MNLKIGVKCYELETTVGRRTVFVRYGNGEKTIPAVGVIGGYGHFSGDLSDEVQPQIDERATIIAPELHGFGGSTTPRRLGWKGLWSKRAEMKAIVEALQQRTDILPPGQQITWVGHSLGAYLATEMIRLFPGLSAGAVLIAPIPLLPFALLTYVWFWLGALLALPTLSCSLLTGINCVCARAVAWLLFSGWRTPWRQAMEYRRTRLHADGAAVFIQVLFLYGVVFGWGIHRARWKGWQGKVVVIGCTQDWLMPRYAVWLTAKLLRAPLLWLPGAHCWFVLNQFPAKIAAVLHSALQLAEIGRRE